MGKADLLKLGLGAAGVGVASDLARPDESEGAFVTRAAIDWAKQNWRKANPGKRIEPFQAEEISKWAEQNITKAIGASTSATERSDKAILAAALKHPEFPNLQSSSINNLRAETAALPDVIHDAVSPSFDLAAPGTRKELQGRFMYSPVKDKTTIMYNPSGNAEGLGVAGHELGTHAPMYVPSFEQYLPKKVLENTRLTRAIDEQHDIARNAIPDFGGDFNSLSKEEKKLMNEKFGLYYGKPGEVAARAMGKGVSRIVQSGSAESLKQVRDPKMYLDELGKVVDRANAIAFKNNPEQYSTAIPKIAVPLAAAGAIGAVSPEEGSASQAKSNIDTSPKIPANVMLGNPEDGIISEGIKGIPRSAVKGLKTVGKVVADTLEGVGRSGLRIADQGRSGKAFAPKGSDYESLGTAASILLNPVGKAAMTAADVVFDWFNPKELSAGEPDPANLKQ